MIKCSDCVKHTYPKNVYELRETLFEKLDAFNIPYRSEQKQLKNWAIFDFKSICVEEDAYNQTETTTWIGKHVPISVFIASNLIQEPIFLCNANPHHLVASFITALERSETQSKAQMKLNFIVRNNTPLEKNYNDFHNLVNSGLPTEQSVAKLRMDRIPPTGAENYSCLQSVWDINNLQNFADLLKWYNNKNVVLTLEAMQKMIEFYHNKGIDLLKLGCTLPNLANICLHKPTD